MRLLLTVDEVLELTAKHRNGCHFATVFEKGKDTMLRLGCLVRPYFFTGAAALIGKRLNMWDLSNPERIGVPLKEYVETEDELRGVEIKLQMREPCRVCGAPFMRLPVGEGEG